MRFKPEQHLEMASRLHERAQAEGDPKRAKKQQAMAEVFHKLATKSQHPG